MLKPRPASVIWGLLGGAILLLLAAWFSGLTGTICEYNQSAQQNECSNYSLAVYVLIKGGAFLNFYGALITALATIAIALFTLSLRESTEKFGEIANTTADAQERDTKILQRAYLAVEPDGIRPLRSDIGKLSGYVKIKNVGHLPARNIRSFIELKFEHDLSPKNFPLEKADGTNVAAPGIVITKGTTNSFDTAQLKTMKREQLFFYV